MSLMTDAPVQYNIYLGNLSPALQSKFLTYYQEAEKNHVSAIEFVKAWNSYAISIEEHVFITEIPNKE